MLLFALLCTGPGLGARLWAQQQLELHMATTFEVTGPTQLIKYTLLLPEEIPGQQEALQISFSHPPQRIYVQEGQRYAEFRFSRPRETLSLQMDLSLRLFPPAPQPDPQLDPARWLISEPLIEVEAPEIQALARQVRGADVLTTLRQSYRAVIRTLRYDPDQQGSLGAQAALLQGQGDCTEFADLLTALLRANGVPARTVNGWVLGVSDTNPNHHWTEVWLPNRGWVPVDPTLGASQLQTDPLRVPPGVHYIRLSTRRLDPLCGSSTNHWKAWGKVEARYHYRHQLRPLLQARQR